ncbi:hypothetical protein WJX72_001670 [[Myrmecia] bisecta]|uniref:Lon N-terminal domain-containing protein n=1 Tax=[Myrmecia] bisecta TaxID=41462 RepID=A0AAW1QEE6_9CHLO
MVFVPLNIFEARYRVLFNTLLSGAEGIDDGLVNESSPFVGSRKFGMCFVDQSGRVAVTGTVLHIEQHTKLESGQMIINSKGGERFAIKKIIEERPVLICDVELLEEAEEDAAEASRLAQELKTLFRDLVTLNLKMKKEKVPADVAEPPELTTLSPRDFSFWVAALLQDSPMTQQQLLEEDSTIKRLQREMDVLGGTVKYLRATSALESAFAPSSGEGSPPPQGGPD